MEYEQFKSFVTLKMNMIYQIAHRKKEKKPKKKKINSEDFKFYWIESNLLYGFYL